MITISTNYYWLRDRCIYCERSERIHICKSLSSFRGYDALDSPTGEPIKSWRDWKQVLTDHKAYIADEYGRNILLSTFIRDVEEVPIEERHRQYNAALITPHYDAYKYDWLDADSYSFTSLEFM